MQGRWRFRILDLDLRAAYAFQGSQPVEHQGSDEEALIIAHQLVEGRSYDISHVQAVSVGSPSDIVDTRGRLLVFVIARYDRRGWMVEGDLMHGSWHRSLQDAVTYGAFRTAGHTSETRIVNVRGDVTHVVLIPSDGRRMTLY